MQPSNSKIKKTQYLQVILAVKCSTQGVWRARLKKTVILYVGTKNLEPLTNGFKSFSLNRIRGGGQNQEGTYLKKRLYKAMPRELNQKGSIQVVF